MPRESIKRKDSASAIVPMRMAGAEQSVVVMNPLYGWSEGIVSSSFVWGGQPIREEPMDKAKPYKISKDVVLKAFQRVKANKGAAGIDDESLEGFEADLKGTISIRFGIGCPPAAISLRRSKR